MTSLLIKLTFKKKVSIIAFTSLLGFVQIFFYIRFIDYYNIDYSTQIIIKSLSLQLFTLCVFDMILKNIETLKSKRLVDLYVSKYGVFKYLLQLYFAIVLSNITIVVLNAIIYQIFIDKLIFNIALLISILIAMIASIVLSLLIYLYQTKDINSFNKLNLLMDFVDILNSKSYPISTLPFPLFIIAIFNLSSYVSFYIDGYNNLIYFLIICTICVALSYLVIKRKGANHV